LQRRLIENKLRALKNDEKNNKNSENGTKEELDPTKKKMYRAQQPLIMATPQPYMTRNPFQLIPQPTLIAQTNQTPYVVRDQRFLAPIAPVIQYVVPTEKKKKPIPEPTIVKVFEKKEEPHHPKYYEPYYKYFDGVTIILT
jgi:hypothetical protein